MKVVVDRDLCQGHGVCESEAPEVFSVSKQGVLTIVDESPPESGRAQVETAVSFCPTRALRIEED
ncbi:MAG TPA: ferredoxin [Acidimicrobiales bacterium]|nr:ferredoxin [Acidimicrobiales bacterium]